MPAPRYSVSLALIALILGGCASSANTPAAGSPSSQPSATAAGLVIRYEESAQFELALPSGRHVYIDVSDASAIEKQPTADDVLLTTVGLPHHYDSAFADSFPGQKIVVAKSEITLPELHVSSFLTSGDGTPIDPARPVNSMMVIEAAGLRVLACGDEDQEALTAEQIAAIGGPIDVAMCPLMNVGGSADPTGRKMLNVIDQIGPKILLPTHISVDVARKAMTEWSANFAAKPAITVRRGTLPATTTMLFLGDQAANYGAVLDLTPTNDW